MGPRHRTPTMPPAPSNLQETQYVSVRLSGADVQDPTSIVAIGSWAARLACCRVIMVRGGARPRMQELSHWCNPAQGRPQGVGERGDTKARAYWGASLCVCRGGVGVGVGVGGSGGGGEACDLPQTTWRTARRGLGEGAALHYWLELGRAGGAGGRGGWIWFQGSWHTLTRCT